MPTAAPPRVIQGFFPAGRPSFLALGRPGPRIAAAPRFHPHAYEVPFAIQLHPSSAGRPLAPAVRERAEACLRADLSGVRIHLGPQAAALGARSFTVGNDIYFTPGQYSPEMPHGLRLLGHELTHVLQQKAGRVRHPWPSGLAVVQDPLLESEAERMGLLLVQHRGSRPTQVTVPAGPVQCKPVQHKAAAPRPSGPAIQPMKQIQDNPGKAAAAAVALLAVTFAAYRFFRWMTETSPGYYVKIPTKADYLPAAAAGVADATLDLLEQRFMAKRDAQGRPKPTHRAMEAGTWLSNIEAQGVLHIIGHGEPVVDAVTRVPQYASLLSGYTTTEVAAMLVDNYRLPAAFRGRIVLLVCHSGTRTADHISLAEDLLAKIRARGPQPVSIKALKGTGTVDEATGNTVVRADEDVGVFDRLNALRLQLDEAVGGFDPAKVRDYVAVAVRALQDEALKAATTQQQRMGVIAKLRSGDNDRIREGLTTLSALCARAALPHGRAAYRGGATNKVVYN